jgi:branched-chain amino acid transport system permease protein
MRTLPVFANRRRVIGSLFGLLAIYLLISAIARHDSRQQVVTGIGIGALIGAIALVVVLTHRASGVVNFAAGGMAVYFMYVYYSLRVHSQLLIPPLPNPLALIEGVVDIFGGNVNLPNWPTFIDLHDGKPMSTPLAFFLTLVIAAIVGYVMYLLVFRVLRNSSGLAGAVASIGLLILFQAVLTLRYGDGRQEVPSIVSQRRVEFLGTFAPLGYFQVAIVLIVLASALWAVTRFTRYGVATTAAAQNEKAVMLLGYSPNALAASSWIIGSVLSAVVGVLTAPLVGLTPSVATVLIVPALAAALLGGMSNFGYTTVAAMGLGIMQALITFYASRTWWPQYGSNPSIALPGVYSLCVLVVIIIALLLRGGGLPSRGATGQLRMPRSVTPRHTNVRVLVVSVIGVVGMLTLSSSWRLAVINTVIGVAICLSVVMLTGFVGQVSVAEMGIAGFAAFVMAKIASDHGVGFPIAPLIGIVCAVTLCLLVALPAIRIRGVNLAIVTLAVAVFVEDFVFKAATKGGLAPGVETDAPKIFGLDLGPNHGSSFRPLGDKTSGMLPNPWFGVFCIVVVGIVALFVYQVRRSPTGLRFLAVRANERAAATEGVNVMRTKLLAFAFAGVIAGIGGMLSSYRFGLVTSNYYGAAQSLLFFAFAYLGGLGGVGGALVGGMFFTGGLFSQMTEEWFHVSNQYLGVLGGIGLVLTVVLNPDGVAGKVTEDFNHVRAKLFKGRLGGHHATAPPPTTDAVGAASTNGHVAEAAGEATQSTERA